MAGKVTVTEEISRASDKMIFEDFFFFFFYT